jgi:glutamate racemase
MIGIFDSGIGGISVLNKIKQLLPNENYLYLSNRSQLPYGEKTDLEIYNNAQKQIAFLKKEGAKTIICACHTASIILKAHDEKEILFTTMLPFILASLKELKGSKVALLGTTKTIESMVYQNLIKKEYPDLEIVSLACPELVTIAESGTYLLQKPIVENRLQLIRDEGCSDIFLACTHFAFLVPLFQKILPDVNVIDPAETIAKQVFANHTPEQGKAKGDVIFFDLSGKNYTFHSHGFAKMSTHMQ